mmetsp:Transcript_25737/g.82843  ORF Transcript_25737/g.82843 Transcript_25737/m.82843 type:complete len:106 (+) Transcript_25737:773-1090(+)
MILLRLLNGASRGLMTQLCANQRHFFEWLKFKGAGYRPGVSVMRGSCALLQVLVEAFVVARLGLARMVGEELRRDGAVDAAEMLQEGLKMLDQAEQGCEHLRLNV